MQYKGETLTGKGHGIFTLCSSLGACSTKVKHLQVKDMGSLPCEKQPWCVQYKGEMLTGKGHVIFTLCSSLGVCSADKGETLTGKGHRIFTLCSSLGACSTKVKLKCD